MCPCVSVCLCNARITKTSLCDGVCICVQQFLVKDVRVLTYIGFIILNEIKEEMWHRKYN